MATATQAAPKLESKTLSFSVKDLAGSPAEVGGYKIYAAAFSNVDRANEVIEPGAFTNLDEFVKNGFMAFGHQWSTALPIGTIDRATQDQYGLLVEGQFHGTEAAQVCRRVMKERLDRGKTVSASIGYQVLRDARSTRDGKPVRILKAIELIEFSWVNVPANPLAVAVKGTVPSPRRASPSEIRQALREYERLFGRVSPEAVAAARLDYVAAVL